MSTKAQRRIRVIQRIGYIESLLQTYELGTDPETGTQVNQFKYTTEDIIDLVLQKYPEEVDNRVVDGMTVPQARHHMRTELHKRVERLKKEGIVAGFRKLPPFRGERKLTGDIVYTWLTGLGNIEGFTLDQLRDLASLINQRIEKIKKMRKW